MTAAHSSIEKHDWLLKMYGSRRPWMFNHAPKHDEGSLLANKRHVWRGVGQAARTMTFVLSLSRA
jgi:hypothetical protein